MKQLIIMSILIFGLLACVQDGGGNSSLDNNEEFATGNPSTPPSNGNGNGAVSTSQTTEDIINSIKVDLRHIIDPYDGTYKTKVTIPKNYQGKLYLSGLNINSLNSQFVYVRFRFGKSRTEKIIQAVPDTAPGITPQTDVDVLILDLKDKPFDDLRLSYKLFDYNDYDSDDDGVEFGTNDDPSVPVSDVRDSGLYCRGLDLEYDSTFTFSTSNNACDTLGEVCLYTYANIEDSGLLNSGTNLYLNPTKPQLNTTQTSYTLQSQSELLGHCLPDVNSRSAIEAGLQTTLNSSSATAAAFGDTAFGGTYVYNGPYRRLDAGNWQISGSAMFSPMIVPGTTPSGLFQYVMSNAPAFSLADPTAQAAGGIKSFLFPRAGKNTYSAGTEYIGFTDLNASVISDRGIRSLASSGETEYVDGCNMRKSFAEISNCNVTATVELVTRSDDNTSWKVLASSTKIKLQLSRDSETDNFGNEVISSAYRTCSSSNACGSNECCYNSRCWSRDLVSQCREDTDTIGNLSVGETCNSDGQCATLCCSDQTNSCAHHDPAGGASCGKNIGAACITKEFCAKEFVNVFKIIRTGTGVNSCSLIPYQVEVNGDCINGFCQAPTAPTIPAFNPSAPDCTLAEPPPTNF